MKILILFEDDYGCYELFKRSKSALNTKGVSIKHGITNPGIFMLDKFLRHKEWDYIVLVFDLDSPTGDFMLTGNMLNTYFGEYVSSGKYRLALVPVFSCFETLYLYSDYIRDKIEKASTTSHFRFEQLVSMYKSYYDYSVISPEYMYNAKNILPDIQRCEIKITGNDSNKPWTVQKFYLKYAVNTLKMLFPGITRGNKSGKIFIKREEALYNEIDRLALNLTSKDLVDSIIDGISAHMVYNTYNKYIYRLLTMTKIEDIDTICTNLCDFKIMCYEIDEYNSCTIGSLENLYEGINLQQAEAMFLRLLLRALGDNF